VPTLLLIRHGRTTANASGLLAGWTPGVGLDETGRAQAMRLHDRLAPLPLALAVTSPLQRTVETATAVLAGRDVEAIEDERLAECRYGDWEGQELRVLAKDPLWKVVQQHPSAVRFPNGESLVEISERAVTAVRAWDATVAADHGPDALWAAFSHGDVIKAITADALGLHLDGFQRIVADPCSVTVIRYTPLRAFVVRTNDIGGDLSGLVPAKRPRSRRAKSVSSDAVPGGGGGAEITAGGAGPDVANAAP
jgi:probable phosphomutase (TIGR03848 family)